MTVCSCCDHTEFSTTRLTSNRPAVSPLFPEIIRYMSIQVLEIKKSEKMADVISNGRLICPPSGLPLPRQLWTK